MGGKALVRMVMLVGLLTVFGSSEWVLAQPLFPGQSKVEKPKISLDLKGVDILDVLKLLSQKSDLNFIAGRNVTGKVTIFAKDVGVWEVFERIIAANDLAYEYKDNVITVMLARDYELLFGQKFQERQEDFVFVLQYAKAIQVASVFNQVKSAIGRVVADETTNTLIIRDVPLRLKQMRELLVELDRPTETRIYELNYADGEEMKDKVQDLLTPIGTYTFDPRTNTVIVSDFPDVLEKVDNILTTFDVAEGQVLIEARILKVELTDAMSLGIDWQRVFAGINWTTRQNFDSLTGEVISDSSVTGGALKLFSSNDTDSELIIEALQSMTNIESLSNPRIMVSNNQEARILVGKREAFVTVTTTVPATGAVVSSPQIEFIDVGTELFVTPNIKRDGHIQLIIRPEVSTATVEIFQNNRIPILTTTKAETSVLVKSGVTIVIGGLIDNSIVKTDNRLPWIGDIPIIGIPFRGKTETVRKSELVIFIKPQIIEPDGTIYVHKEKEETPRAVTKVEEVVLSAPVSSAYQYVVRKKLERYLTQQFKAASLSKGSVVVSFVLNHDGGILESGKVDSPQGLPFIMAATAALVEADPFPPFPEGSRASEVRFRMAVEYVPDPVIETPEPITEKTEREHESPIEVEEVQS